MTQQLTVIGSIEAYGGSIYQTVTSSMLKANASGQIIAAIAGTDYLAVGSAVTSVSATSPILSSGGTTPNISIPAATTSVSGYLTSTDWTTFNNKGTFSLPSLTSGSVLFSNGSTIAQDNANFFWDDVNNRLGIGTSSPTEILHIVGGSAIVYIDGNSAGTQTSATLRLRTGGFNVGNFRYNVATDNIEISNVSAGGAVTSGAVKIYGTSGSTTGLTIAAAGGGTFASTLTVGTTAFVTNDIFIGDTTSGSGRFFITDSSNQGITLRRTAATGDRFKMFVGNGTTYTQDNCIILGTNTDIDFYTGSSPVKRLTIGNGGESTFSGGVTSASFFNVLKNGSDSGFSGPYIAVSNAANNVTWGWQLGASNQLALFSYASSTIKNPLNITITGNVGIGTSSPDTKLSIQRPSGNFGIVNGIGFKDQGGTTVAGIGIEGANTNDMQIMGSVGIRFYTNSDLSSTNERMRISSAGYTKISNNGTYINNSLYYHEIRQSGDDWILAATCTSATDPRGIYLAYPSMSPNSSSAFFLYCEDSTATRFYISSDGYVHSRSTSIVIISSDENLKKDITDYDKGLSEVLAMKPRYYRYKAEPEKLQIGFIAQEMDEALKGSMIDSNEKNEETGENYKTYQVEWYPLLVKAIQEQNQMITSLQEQINELKNK